MRQVVRASLPLGEGIVLDPFMGAGSTIAAAIAVGYQSVGIESDATYFDVALMAIPKLSALSVNGTTRTVKTNDVVSLNGRAQLGFFGLSRGKPCLVETNTGA
jgi:DNA modification methylase